MSKSRRFSLGVFAALLVAVAAAPARAESFLVGYHDGVAGGTLSGWAIDTRRPSESITVHVYFSMLGGAPTFLGAARANFRRDDVNLRTGLPGFHGFSIPLPPAVAQGYFQLYVYAIGYANDGAALLAGSPQSTVNTSLTNPAAVPAIPPFNTAVWNTLFQAQSAELASSPHRVLFLGDSITQLWSDPAHGGPWWNVFSSWGASDFGIGGDTTEGLLYRIFAGVPVGSSLKVAVLLIGTNNFGLGHTPEQVAEGIKANVNAVLARAPGARVLVVSLLPRGDNNAYGRWYRSRIARVNALVRGLRNDRSVFVADYTPYFLDGFGAANPALFDAEPDPVQGAVRVHPNGVGYALLGSLLAPTIRNLLNM